MRSIITVVTTKTERYEVDADPTSLAGQPVELVMALAMKGRKVGLTEQAAECTFRGMA